MNQLCLNPRSELGCHHTAIAAFWERLARELAEEWCDAGREDEATFSPEAASSPARRIP